MSASRVGRKPVTIPAGVKVEVKSQQSVDHETADNGEPKFKTLLVTGPKGSLSEEIHNFVVIGIDNGTLSVHSASANENYVGGFEAKLYRSILGTVRARIANIIHGVTKGFERKLNLVGVGYRAQAKGNVLSLSLGFSHPVEFLIPKGIVIETPIPTEILIKGMDKDVVGEVAASIRKIRPPEPYKGKGVRYSTETIELKETKKK